MHWQDGALERLFSLRHVLKEAGLAFHLRSVTQWVMVWICMCMCIHQYTCAYTSPEDVGLTRLRLRDDDLPLIVWLNNWFLITMIFSFSWNQTVFFLIIYPTKRNNQLYVLNNRKILKMSKTRRTFRSLSDVCDVWDGWWKCAIFVICEESRL